MENRSAHDTRQRLMELGREGLPVIAIDDPEVEYAQSGEVSSLLISTTEHFRPDWVWPLDMTFEHGLRGIDSRRLTCRGPCPVCWRGE